MDSSILERSRQEIAEQLKNAYRASYNIYENDESDLPMLFWAEYYEHSEQYIISKKAEVWSANCEEFIYFYSVENLDLDTLNKGFSFAVEDGSNRASIDKKHMYTYITPMFVYESIDSDALEALKKLKHYKSFKFGFNGWLDTRVAGIDVNKNKIETNGAGKCLIKNLEAVLFPKEKKKAFWKYIF